MAKKIIKQYPLTILCTVAIAILSLAPIGAPEVARDVPFFDKWAHFVMYGGLALTVGFELLWQVDGMKVKRKEKEPRWFLLLIWLLLFPAFWGGLMELGQAYLTTYRSGEWLDFFADSVGAALGTLVIYCLSKV